MRYFLYSGLIWLYLLHLNSSSSVGNLLTFFTLLKLLLSIMIVWVIFRKVMIVFLLIWFWLIPFWFSFFKIANFLIKSLILIFLFKIQSIKIHNLIFKFPQWIFHLILIFFILLNLLINFSLLLNIYINTYSIYLIYSWCLRFIADILSYIYSHYLCLNYFIFYYSICIFTFCFFSSYILKIFCWLYLRPPPRTNILFYGGVA